MKEEIRKGLFKIDEVTCLLLKKLSTRHHEQLDTTEQSESHSE